MRAHYATSCRVGRRRRAACCRRGRRASRSSREHARRDARAAAARAAPRRRAHPAVGAGRDRRRPDLGPHDAPALPARRRRRARAAGARDRRRDPRAAAATTTRAPQILCGDFNATPDSDEMRFLRGLTTLDGRRTHFQDAWLRLHRECQPGDGPAQGITWSSENELTRPLRSLDIDRRIDYVYVTSRKKDGRATVHASPRRARPSAKGRAPTRSARAITTACSPTSRSSRRRSGQRGSRCANGKWAKVKKSE